MGKIIKIPLMCICLFIIGICLSACGGGKSTPPTYPIIPVPTPTPIPTPTPTPVAPEIQLSNTLFEINIGDTDNITVTLDGEDVTEEAIYTPDDENIATVEKGLITAHNQGTTIVNVHVEGAKEDKTFTVNVIDPSLPKLELSQDNFALTVGHTDNITVTLEGQDVTEEVTYTPNDEAIATVEKGVITALSKGSTDVVVSLEGANNSIFTVNVDLPTLKLSKPQSDLGIGDTDNVTVTLEDKDVTKDVTYTNENENIATVDKGNIQAQYQEGETTITVSMEGANNATFTVTVTDDSTDEVELNQNVYTKLYELGLVDKDYDNRKELTKINIPGTYKDGNDKYKITSIGERFFENCTKLETITIPNSIKTIKQYAFNECTALGKASNSDASNSGDLKTITIPDSVTEIETYAFCGCTSLEKLVIPNSVTKIGNFVCWKCTSLQTLILGNGITEITTYQFSNKNNNLKSLVNVTIGTGVKTIGEKAFADYNITSIEIPDNVETIGREAFTACTQLDSVTFGTNSSLKTIRREAFSACGYRNYKANLTLRIPDNVTTIESNAFSKLKCICYTENLQVSVPDNYWGALDHKIITD